jgi:acyl-CoA hydrolase/GNAT superfamily N-acetyltransferase
MSATIVQAKTKTAAEAIAAAVRSGQRVFIGTGCALPGRLVSALEASPAQLRDVEVFHFLTSGLGKLLPEGKSRFRHRCFFVGQDMRAMVASGQAQYVPISLGQVARLVEVGRIRSDVALIQVSPPDAHGFVSLGISVDIIKAVLRTAGTVIAQINPQMPRTHGNSLLHLRDIDHVVPTDEPIEEFVHEPIDEIARRIARYVAEIIGDGATLQVDLGRIPSEVLRHLKSRRDLGIHSTVITDAVIDLIEAGVITGRRKRTHPGRIVTSFCFGTRALYDLVDDNALFEFHPVEYVADPARIAQNPQVVALTQAFAVDLTGQACVDQFRGNFYSGVSTVPEFHQGAAASPGGKPIVCLRSTTDDGSESAIRPQLLAGEAATLARSDVHYVVTEFGVAYLFGKSVSERAIALVEIAHPAFREALLKAARDLHLLPAGQILPSRRPYLVEEERTVELKDGRSVRLRPARAGDVPHLKALFHRMRPEEVYLRFFHTASELTFEEAQRLCSVDFELDVAFVAVSGPHEHEEVVGTGAYFLNPATGYAEIAYMMAPDYQGCGLGRAVQQRLKEYAVAHGVKGFTGEILARNQRALQMVQSLGSKVELTSSGEIYSMIAHFESLNGR